MKLWGGNYGTSPDAVFWEFNRSFPFDQRLLAEEIAASQAYVRALARAAALPQQDAERLVAGLGQILARAQAEEGYLAGDHEDVHSFVETRLTELVGEVAGQAHLGRSRNEQTVTALRLYLRMMVDRLRGHIGRIVQGLCEQGSHAADAVMPGFTHTRLAEPITFGHFAGAHAWALVRDIERLADARRRVDVLPLGSGALAGTALPIDREALARDLGFGAVSENALDAVMDRDFAIEVVFVCAQIQHHLSRLAEDLIWQSGPEFGFFRIPEAFTTGSSLMPQKKNPDALELIRGKTGRVLGALVGSLEITKGLPTGYQKDLQEDKEAVFDALDTTLGSALVMAGVIAGLEIHRARMRAAAAHEEMMAAGLAVAIAREGVPFRKAHGIVGRLVAESQRTGESLKKTAARLLPGEAPAVVAQIEALFDPDQAVRMKAARGGTAPQAVLASLAAARQRVEDLKER